MAREPMDALVASANQLGLKPAVVDPRAGLLQSRWEDTRRRAAPIKERDAVVVRRFVIHLEHGSFGNDVTLNIEARRCVLLAFTLTETDVTGTCEPMTRLDQPLLKELAAVGSRLQQLMSIP